MLLESIEASNPSRYNNPVFDNNRYNHFQQVILSQLLIVMCHLTSVLIMR